MDKVIVGNLLVESRSKDIEAKNEGEDWFIEGVFAEAELLNENGRIYKKNVLEDAVNQYIEERVKTKRAIMENGHPGSPKINFERACALVTELKQDGNKFYGKAKILHDDCPHAKIMRGLIKSGVGFGVSTRGLGSAEEMNYDGQRANVVNEFVLRAIDCVDSPSCPTAYVNAIQEEKKYILDGSSDAVYEFNEETYKMFESRLSNLPKNSKSKEELYFEATREFLLSLKGNK